MNIVDFDTSVMLSASGVGRVRVAPLSYTPSQPAILSSADSLSSSGDAGSVFTLDRKKRKMHGGRPALNPLRMFPSKSDTLVAGLFHSTGGAYDAHRSAGGDRGGLLLLSATQGSDRDRGTEQQQQPPVQWLHPEIIDANFGIEVIFIILTHPYYFYSLNSLLEASVCFFRHAGN